MIQTDNPELDALITALSQQRNDALDTVAVLAQKLSQQEALAKSLKEQLEAALKKEGE